MPYGVDLWQQYLPLFVSRLEGSRGAEAHVCRVLAASLPSPPAPWTPGGHGAGGTWVSGAVDCGELWSAVGQDVLVWGRRTTILAVETLAEEKCDTALMDDSRLVCTCMLASLWGGRALMFIPFASVNLLSLLSVLAFRWAGSGVRALPGTADAGPSFLVPALARFRGNHSPALECRFWRVSRRL